MQRDHIHSNLLEQNVSMISASPEPICFYKVKAHNGIAENACADAIAKHSALHDGGHEVHFQPPAPDGNAYHTPVLLFSILENLRFTSRPDLANLKTFV